MCGRYTLHITKKKLAEAIALEIPEIYEPDYNIGPGRDTLGILQTEDTAKNAEMLHWGLRTPQNFHINARLEAADTTPRFRESWLAHRCLIPANGYYEWYQDGITKVPYYIYPADRSLTYFAGLWFPSDYPNEHRTCVLLTTSAIPSVKQIHGRMPVMLQPQHHENWLNHSLNKESVLELTQTTSLSLHSVSRRVNSVQNKDSRLIEATSPLTDDQMMLF